MEKLLRKLFNKLFKGTAAKRLSYDLKKSAYIKIQNFTSEVFELNIKNHLNPLYLRNRPSSDYDVFVQVFLNGEYSTAISSLKSNFISDAPIRIIDAGANVGYTSRYFLSHFNNPEIACVEPDKGNFEILKRNLSGFPTVSLYLNALAAQKNEKFDIVDTFRDGNDWSKSVCLDTNGAIYGITLEEIMHLQKWTQIDLLKIDVEGAEKFIFENTVYTGFLKNTKVIAMEIHEESIERSTIIDILKSYNFILHEAGELTIGVNRDWIKES